MSTTVEQAVRRMDQLTGTVIAATVQEMRAAAYAIARQTKDQHPSVERVHRLFELDRARVPCVVTR